jgi:hypothetical protein
VDGLEGLTTFLRVCNKYSPGREEYRKSKDKDQPTTPPARARRPTYQPPFHQPPRSRPLSTHRLQQTLKYQVIRNKHRRTWPDNSLGQPRRRFLQRQVTRVEILRPAVTWAGNLARGLRACTKHLVLEASAGEGRHIIDSHSGEVKGIDKETEFG